jgi:hypothetical protein
MAARLSVLLPATGLRGVPVRWRNPDRRVLKVESPSLAHYSDQRMRSESAVAAAV